MRIHRITIHQGEWGDNDVKVEASISPVAAEAGKVYYEFHNVSELVLESIRDWAWRESSVWGKEGHITPLDHGWAWWSGVVIMA